MERLNLTSAELRAAAERQDALAGASAGTATSGGPSMEVAHVLFMDMVGYSRLRSNQQASAQIEMQNLVNASPEVRQAMGERRFVCRPAGDGMALLFFRDIVSPVRTALQIHEEMHKNAAAIQARIGAPLKLRMGIHSGVVLMVEDLNAQSDAAGEGINIAQRVMDCGDADHILLSSKVAESLLTVDPWQHYLRDLGKCRVKHGVVIHLYLLHGRLSGGYYGNVAIPSFVSETQEEMEREASRYRGSYFQNHPEMRGRLATFAVLAALASGGLYGWTKVPAFKNGILTTYTGLQSKLKPSAPSPPPKAGSSKHGSSGAHRGHASGGDRSSTPRRHQDDDAVVTSRFPVPDVLGHSLEDAQGIAENQGLHIARNPSYGYNTQYGEGQIYHQSPEGGATAPPGSRITVQISKGDPPDPSAPGANP